MPDKTVTVLDDPLVVEAIAKLQRKFDTREAALATQNAELTRKLDEFTSAVDSIDVSTDDEGKPRSVTALTALKTKATAEKARAAEVARQAESRELARHRTAIDLYEKYGVRGVKLADLLGLADEVAMREHVISVLETATTQVVASGRVPAATGALPNKGGGTKADFLNDVKDLFEEGKREGRVVFRTQSFD